MSSEKNHSPSAEDSSAEKHSEKMPPLKTKSGGAYESIAPERRGFWYSDKMNVFLSKFGYSFLGLWFFVMLLFGLGFDFMLPGGAGWSVFLIWASSFCAGKIMEYWSIPGLLGMLISGIILKNLPGELVDGLPDTWAATLRSFGLSLILMRSGLELDIPALKKQGWVAARLTVLPGVCEAFAVSVANMLIFGMPFALGLSGGFILAAVSPAVVVSGMFFLQANGYGVKQGIPSLVVAAASFDDVVAISGFSMCIGLAVEGGEDPLLGALHGPINVIAGGLLGYVGGHIVGCSRIFNSDNKRAMAMIVIGLTFMFVAAQLHYTGAGALAGLVTGVFASISWQTANMGWLSSGPLKHSHHEVEHSVARLWEMFAQPVLFGIIGASVDFSVIDASVIPSAIGVVLAGTIIRIPVAFLATGGKGLSFWERAFIGLTWVPKATVQAALGSVPLMLVHEAYEKDHPDFEKYERWGEQILVTAVISILMTAPIGLIVIAKLGPRWLEKSEDDVEVMEVLLHDGENDDEESVSTTSGVEGPHAKKKLVRVRKVGMPGEQDDWFTFEAHRREREALRSQGSMNSIHLARFYDQLNERLSTVERLLRDMEKSAGKRMKKNGGSTSPEPSREANDFFAQTIKAQCIKARDELRIAAEGVQSTMNVIDREGARFPAFMLFNTPGHHYINKATKEEVLQTLNDHVDDLAAENENFIELPEVQRTRRPTMLADEILDYAGRGGRADTTTSGASGSNADLIPPAADRSSGGEGGVGGDAIRVRKKHFTLTSISVSEVARALGSTPELILKSSASKRDAMV